MLPEILLGRRILIVTGHYGSGKTELSVSLAMALSRNNETGFPRLALCDLDVVNPYFRSRERMDLLESVGVKVYGGIYGKGSAAEIPELSAAVRAPLDDKGCFTIIDAGGNDAGARILKQFSRYFTREERFTLAVVNASRPDTADVQMTLEQHEAIESALGFEIDGYANNTHMLMETTAATVEKGHRLCSELSAVTGRPLLWDCYPEKLVSAADVEKFSSATLPVGMYMRQTWLDK